VCSAVCALQAHLRKKAATKVLGGAGRASGIEALEEDTRGWDHGVPLALAFPTAELPLVEISVLGSLDPEVGTEFPVPRFCGLFEARRRLAFCPAYPCLHATCSPLTALRP